MRSWPGVTAALVAAFALPLISTAEACVPPKQSVLLILDFSDSMIAKVPSGEMRIDVARHAVEEVVNVFPPEAHLALRVYGSETAFSYRDCRDTRLLVPFAAAGENKQAILDAIYAVRPKGMTPIANALTEARSDFMGDTEDRVIVVVSDGRETCDNNPCAAASALARDGFVIHTVGLVVDRNAALQLKCLSTVSGGMYLDVPNALELPEKLRDLFQACKISSIAPSDIRRSARAQAFG
jgi:Ca-activated chloride channel family protein